MEMMEKQSLPLLFLMRPSSNVINVHTEFLIQYRPIDSIKFDYLSSVGIVIFDEYRGKMRSENMSNDNDDDDKLEIELFGREYIITGPYAVPAFVAILFTIVATAVLLIVSLVVTLWK